jgi:HEAT repeat protein
MSTSFDSLLAALASPGEVLPRADLAFLSDLDASQIDRLRRAWPSLDTDRRRDILREIGLLATDHIELNFDRVDRLALEDSDAEVRRRAIGNLWESEDPALAPALVTILVHDPDDETRAAAASALGTFVYLGEIGRVPADVLHRLEPELLRSAQEGDPRVRLSSLESLGYSSRPEVPGLIRAAYLNGEDRWKRASLVAMARSADEGWEPEVLAELRSPSPALRLEAARSAGELELRGSVAELVDLLDDADIAVRRASIWSLGQIGGKRSADVLGRLLKAGDEEEVPLIEDALNQLAFVNGTRDLSLLDVDEEADEENNEEDAGEGNDEEGDGDGEEDGDEEEEQEAPEEETP